MKRTKTIAELKKGITEMSTYLERKHLTAEDRGRVTGQLWGYKNQLLCDDCREPNSFGFEVETSEVCWNCNPEGEDK